MGIFLESVKAKFSKWKFLNRWIYQSWSCMTNISNHMEGNLINKHMMNNFYHRKACSVVQFFSNIFSLYFFSIVITRKPIICSAIAPFFMQSLSIKIEKVAKCDTGDKKISHVIFVTFL